MTVVPGRLRTIPLATLTWPFGAERSNKTTPASDWLSGFMNTTGRHLTGIGAAALGTTPPPVLTRPSVPTRSGEHYRRRQHGHCGARSAATPQAPTTLPPVILALYSNTRGNLNTANGRLSALYSNTTGIGNTAGGDALVSNTTAIAISKPSVRVRSLPTQSATSISPWALLQTLAPQATTISILAIRVLLPPNPTLSHRQLIAHGHVYRWHPGNRPFYCSCKAYRLTRSPASLVLVVVSPLSDSRRLLTR